MYKYTRIHTPFRTIHTCSISMGETTESKTVKVHITMFKSTIINYMCFELYYCHEIIYVCVIIKRLPLI